MYKAQRDTLDDTILAVSGRTLKEYRMDTGEGMQRGELQEINDLMKQVTFLDSRIERLYAQLSGRGVVNSVLRRFPC
jgi:hypothetical protein